MRIMRMPVSAKPVSASRSFAEGVPLEEADGDRVGVGGAGGLADRGDAHRAHDIHRAEEPAR